MVTFSRGWGGGSVAENLFNMNKALVLNSNTAKRKKRINFYLICFISHEQTRESQETFQLSPG